MLILENKCSMNEMKNRVSESFEFENERDFDT